MFSHEARLTRLLSEHYPSEVPTVIAADGDRNWLLMESFHGTPLAETAESLPWQESFRLFARMQIESIARRDELLALGCFDREINHLPSQLATLLDDRAALRPGGDDLLSEAQVEALHNLQPQVASALERLGAYNLPSALLHGDLHPHNVVITSTGPLFYDWSDGAIGHPFFELLTTADSMRGAASDPEAQKSLLRAYLEPWTAFTGIEELEAAFVLSQKLLPCYHALSYYWIVRHTEPSAQWELGGGVGFFLNLLLQVFGQGDVEPGSDTEKWAMS